MESDSALSGGSRSQQVAPSFADVFSDTFLSHCGWQYLASDAAASQQPARLATDIEQTAHVINMM